MGSYKLNFQKMMMGASAIALAVTAPATFAQDKDETKNLSIEEIIITAEKRAASVQDTPIAVTAFSSDMMDDLGIVDASDLMNFTPSMSFRADPPRIFMRGVGLVDNSLGIDPGVAVYVDGMYYDDASTASRNSFDTERIEILRGPQGTLFGRNAIGGAVSIYTKRPSDEFKVDARLRMGNYNTMEMYGAVSGPVTDNIRIRLSGGHSEHAGYIKNLSGPDLQEGDFEYVALAVEIDLADNLELFVRGSIQGANFNETGNYSNLLSPYYTDASISGLAAGGQSVAPGTGDPHISALYLSPQNGWGTPNPTVDDPRVVDFNNVPEVTMNNSRTIAGTLTWDLDSVTVKYIGGYDTYDWILEGEDLDKTSNPTSELVIDVGQYYNKQSHELQIISNAEGALRWNVGAYYFKEDKQQPYWQRNLADDDLLTWDSPGWTFAGLFTDPSSIADIQRPRDNILYYQYGEQEVESYAFYGEMTYQINEEWSVTGGLRYSHDEKVGREEQLIVLDPKRYGLDYSWFDVEGCCGILNSYTPLRELTGNWSNVSGRAVLKYTPDDDTMMYASISTGYKSGGFRLGAITIDEGEFKPVFDDEKVMAFEVGYKGTIDDRLQINAAAYYYNYDNMQVKSTIIHPVSQSNIEMMVNAPKATMYGFELETVYLINGSWRAMLNYSYTHGEFDELCCFTNQYYGNIPKGQQDLAGNSTVMTPPHKVSFSTDYTVPFDTGSWTFAGNFSYIGRQHFTIFNDPQLHAKSFSTVDAFMTWRPAAENWKLNLYMKNAFDNDAITSMQVERKHQVTGTANPPRTWGFQLDVSF